MVTFAALYQREYLPLVRLGALLVGSVEIAEDVVQDAFMRVHRRFGQLDNPGAYVRACVVNGSRDRLRRRKRFDARAPLLAVEPIEGATAPTMGDRVDLVRALSTLPSRQRVVLVLRYYGNWTVAEIAAALDMPAGTVKTAIHRGLRKLRTEMEP